MRCHNRRWHGGEFRGKKIKKKKSENSSYLYCSKSYQVQCIKLKYKLVYTWCSKTKIGIYHDRKGLWYIIMGTEDAMVTLRICAAFMFHSINIEHIEKQQRPSNIQIVWTCRPILAWFIQTFQHCSVQPKFSDRQAWADQWQCWYPDNIFLISLWKHMLWVLIRSASVRHF